MVSLSVDVQFGWFNELHLDYIVRIQNKGNLKVPFRTKKP